MKIEKESLYFGCGQGYLDITTLQYRWFGAIWKYQDSVKVVIGYWFGDSANEVRKQTRMYGHVHYGDASQIQEVYSTIRDIQKEQDWKQRSRLPFITSFRSPWKDVRTGWYIIRSRQTYPFYVSAVQKKRFSVWLEHVSVCETERDLNEFMGKVIREHDIQLQPLHEIYTESLSKELRMS